MNYSGIMFVSRSLMKNKSVIFQYCIFNVARKGHLARLLSTDGILSEEKYLKTTEKNGVRTIRLNNSLSRNALSLEMLKTLVKEIKRDENNKDFRSIVITSEPGKVFSAGHDLKELTDTNTKLHTEIFETCSELMRVIIQSPVPVIAAVDGLAVAAGCQLVAACDIAICTERSSFSTPGANVGIFCSTPGIPLVRNVPRKTAMYMLFTGFPISGREAYECGLVSKVVPNNKLDEETSRITNAINTKSRSVIHIGKMFLYEQIDLDILTAYFRGAETMVKNLKMRDTQEGIRSFLEKKKAIWTHNYENN
ncbi:enoyl-CoA hydratase domain-containing protein 3, mitochondrial isoform X3 [Pseudomyrmex gracilis]|uniref:enoyl-CoA hydratase domain-containing protein 3, mitochondrial isoform X3 n=1 Tax=Pseudomyrmex gracilis TaxID=219809 RepID=UPI000995338C|nr:enoyl-CoA hydratase domain-containing protein 3, mitochondrial isoform X3 [Pseudomyrmex gracilis]